MPRIARALIAGAAFAALLAAPAAAQALERIHGHDRVATAVAVSQAQWTTAEEVVLVTADAFADAVASTALAARVGGPILLTTGDRLPTRVADELERLGPTRVWVLGGDHAVPEGVSDQLQASGHDVTRIAGQHRYATARRAALAAGPSPTGTVVVASGDPRAGDRGWPDAVAAATLTGGPDQLPLLLTRTDRLPQATQRGLEDLGATRVVIAGGQQAVSAEVEDHLRMLGHDVERVAGPSRYHTSTALAGRALDEQPGDGRQLVTATGAAFPDALSAGALAAATDGVVVLVPPGSLPQDTDRWLREHRHRFAGGITVGGAAAVGQLVVDQVAAALRGEPRPEPPPPPPPEPEPMPGADAVVGIFEGQASWYGGRFAGRTTACGERFDPQALTAAHRTLACGSRVRVTNAHNGVQVTVRINDRGPYIAGRVIDVSEHAAAVLGFRDAGLTHVHGEVLATHGAAAAGAEPSGPGITHPDRGGR